MRPLPQPIVALDVASMAEARAVVLRLGERADFYKVGLQLFAAEGPTVVQWLREEGKRVFLDLKLHDIPNTVGRAAVSARRLGATLLTVHGLGGREMIRAAVEGGGDATGMLIVTLLTSMDTATASDALGRRLPSVEGEVLRLAGVARSEGAHGVVCGGAEAAAVCASPGRPLRVLVPGIRSAGSAPHDQSRVATPAEAARAGATYVVFGRAVTQAADMVDAYDRFVRELAEDAGGA